MPLIDRLMEATIKNVVVVVIAVVVVVVVVVVIVAITGTIS